ncbi:Sapep family Mn(2+)-dependent dipeptidase [uncultured Clostridium sp.]|uniref:Sapep family Mn(2+)-dependent dipeptidase n=1 Tax=uncultured Clostridium sp. TaxID=59620 RepID=UPI0026305F72|nr:Sapep family Mn(2+)-dependent dipeptidase [uncultured Clostridium sp.]
MFKERIKKEEKELLKSIEKVVEINSIEGKQGINAPFGEEPKRALEKALEIAKEMGFKVKNIDNVIGYAEYGQEDSSDEYICALGHLDIVEAGENWDYDPFKLTMDNGRLYGRGVLDNKGPIMCCLHGMKIIKDMNLDINKKIRVIFGTNEETGFKDIPYYLKEEKLPVMGFTPDCKYPAVYGERGILDITIWSKDIIENVLIDSDFVNNVVPSECKLIIDGNLFGDIGEKAPGNAPEFGVNAVTKLVDRLKNMELSENLKEFFAFVAKEFHENHNMEKNGIKCEDEISGKLVINPYGIVKKDNKIGVSVVFRYPISYKYEDILEIIRSVMEEGNTLTENRRMDSVLFPKDGEMLKILKDSYEEATGFDGTPVTTTGGTYAKVFKNIVAFGPSFPGQKGIAHNKNEYMELEDLMTNLEIYTNALYKLAK